MGRTLKSFEPQSLPQRPTPILLLEVNEVPWRVIDHYVASGRFPNLSKLLANGKTYTTVTVDEGELSPWVTWPSLHRGMSNTRHQIKNLGQDPSTFKGVPIWEEFRSRGYSIGVCGSLQSWPPMNPGKNGFYLPDTFSHDATCIPEILEPFQRFNLAQVRKNGRVVDKKLPIERDALGLLKSMPNLGVRVRTLARIAFQIVGERWQPEKRARRPVFQAILAWDIFKKFYKPVDGPEFASFFTNHVAGVMHRYWHHVFPADFSPTQEVDPINHRATMDFAMAFMDEMLGDAMSMVSANPNLVLIVASSMGQAAVKWERHEGVEAVVADTDALMFSCGIPKTKYKPLLAMVPQVAVEIEDVDARTRVSQVLTACSTEKGAPLFSVEEKGNSLSITIKTPPRKELETKWVLMGPSKRRIPLEEAGIRVIEVEAGTAYHIPEGILITYGKGVEAKDSRERIPADSVKSMLMELAGLKSTNANESHSPMSVGAVESVRH